MSIKKSEIKMSKYNCEEGKCWYQVVINDHCVTEAYRSADAAWKDYVKQLIDAIDGARESLNHPDTY